MIQMKIYTEIDIEKTLMVPTGKVGGRINQKFGISIYILLYKIDN